MCWCENVERVGAGERPDGFAGRGRGWRTGTEGGTSGSGDLAADMAGRIGFGAFRPTPGVRADFGPSDGEFGRP